MNTPITLNPVSPDFQSRALAALTVNGSVVNSDRGLARFAPDNRNWPDRPYEVTRHGAPYGTRHVSAALAVIALRYL